MSGQERIQLKRPPLDPWSTRELLWLVSAVTRNGDQNWVSVARSLKPLVAENTRPPDWFSQRSCAAQYGALLERAEAPRRKKRISDGNVSAPPPSLSSETPQQIIYNKLKQDRIQELQKIMAEEEQTMYKLQEDVKDLYSGNVSEARLRAMLAEIEQEQRLKQCESAKHNQWLRERAERKSDQGWRKPESDAPHSSPLLTSLLQSPTTIAQLPPTEPITDNSTSTISTVPITTAAELTVNTDDSQSTSKVDLQKIEQIKSELQEIENLIANSNADSESMINVLNPLHSVTATELPIMKETPTSETAKTPEKIEIDDIEIKAEDVYAFSDIDLDIPPVSSIHKTPLGRTSHLDKNLFNKREIPAAAPNIEKGNQLSEQENIPDSTETAPAHTMDVVQMDVKEDDESNVIKEESADKSESVTHDQDITEEIENKVSEDSVKTDNKSIPTENAPKTDNPSTNITIEEEDSDRDEMNKSVSELKKDIEAKKHHENVEDNTEVPISDENDSTKENNPDKEKNKIDISSMMVELTTTTEDQSMISADSHSEIYDDAPMEVIKEDKPGKKRDYSRKKPEKEERHSPVKDLDNLVVKSDFTDEIGSDNSQESSDKKILSKKLRNELSVSRSESPATPIDSLPNSPAPATSPPHSSQSTSQNFSEQDKDYKTWKKSILNLLNDICAMKYASLFSRPITDEHAPGYSQAVKKPMDLFTIRRNIDSGLVKTTQEFQRDVLLMLTNALMYNRTDHRVYTMARETMQEVSPKIKILLQALAHTAAQAPSFSRTKRPNRPASRQATVKRKRGSGNETPTMKKRRTDEN